MKTVFNKIKRPLTVLLLTSLASMTCTAGVDPGALNSYNISLQQMLNTTGWNFAKAIDTKQISNDWQANQARAEIKYSRPGVYRGRVSKIVMDNGNANLILDYGKSSAVTVILASYQASSWKSVKNHLEVEELQLNREFAASIDSGEEFYFQCPRVVFSFGVYLANCIAFSPNIALGNARPEVVDVFDVAAHFDDLIRARASEGWARPPSARQNMTVTLQIGMATDGTIMSVDIDKSSGDSSYDRSTVAAIKNIGRLSEAQEMKPSDIAKYRLFKMSFTPDDLTL